MTDCASSPRAVIMELADFAKLAEKFKLTEKKVPALWPNRICILSMTSMVWNISIGQIGLGAWLCSLPAPAHLLISWTWETA